MAILVREDNFAGYTPGVYTPASWVKTDGFDLTFLATGGTDDGPCVGAGNYGGIIYTQGMAPTRNHKAVVRCPNWKQATMIGPTVRSSATGSTRHYAVFGWMYGSTYTVVVIINTEGAISLAGSAYVTIPGLEIGDDVEISLAAFNNSYVVGYGKVGGPQQSVTFIHTNTAEGYCGFEVNGATTNVLDDFKIYAYAGGNRSFGLTDEEEIYYSLGNWDALEVGDYGVTVDTLQTSDNGASILLTSEDCTDVRIYIDSTAVGGGASPTHLLYTVDDGAQQVANIEPDVTSYVDVLAGGVFGAHHIEIIAWLEAATGRYTTDANTNTNHIRVTGWRVNADAIIKPFALGKPKKAICMGDSITYSWGSDTGSNHPRGCYVRPMGDAIGAVVSPVGFVAQGWSLAGGGYTPVAFTESWNKYGFGRPRNFTGLDYVIINHGTNDGMTGASFADVRAAILAVLTPMRVAVGPTVPIILLTPPGGWYDGLLDDVVTTYGDPKLYHVTITDKVDPRNINGDGKVSWMSSDGIHLTNSSANAHVGASYGEKIKTALAPIGTSNLCVSVGVS